MTRPLISSGSATSFSKSQLAIFTFSRAEVQFSEQRRCGAEDTKRLGLSDLFSGRASCSLIRISNCGAVWESWGCSVTNTSRVSVPNQFPVVKADDTTDGNGPGNVLEKYIFLSDNHTWKADNWKLLQRWWLSRRVEHLTQVALLWTVTVLVLLHLHFCVGVGKWWCSPTKAATPRLAHHEGFGVELNEGGGSEGAHRLPSLALALEH